MGGLGTGGLDSDCRGEKKNMGSCGACQVLSLAKGRDVRQKQAEAERTRA